MITRFASLHGAVLRKTERQIAASFEIACFHTLLSVYEKDGYGVTAQNLVNGAFRYLTSPAGNPANFSYVVVGRDGEEFDIRQQVRIESHVNSEIRFTPDIVVLKQGTIVGSTLTEDYSSGKKPFYWVSAANVIAAHECKSMNPFPELLVSFLGMLVAGHAWYPLASLPVLGKKGHPAPTLFVGGSARSFHLSMVKAIRTSYPVNIVVGMHERTAGPRSFPNRLAWPSQEPFSSASLAEIQPDPSSETSTLW